MRLFGHGAGIKDATKERWRPREDHKLAKLAGKDLTVKQCAAKLGRSEAGVRARAQHLGISFKPNAVR